MWKYSLFLLQSHHIQQLGQWPYAFNYDVFSTYQDVLMKWGEEVYRRSACVGGWLGGWMDF